MLQPLHSLDTLHRRDVPKSRSLCGVSLQAILLVLFASGVLQAAAPTGRLTAQVSNITVPTGGTAQIRILLADPHALVSGEVVMDLDPAVFGDITAADVFSATGDQVGTVSIQGRHRMRSFPPIRAESVGCRGFPSSRLPRRSSRPRRPARIRPLHFSPGVRRGSTCSTCSTQSPWCPGR